MIHKLESLTEQIIHACKNADLEVIEPLRSAFDKIKITSKDDSGRNFVTQADVETERHLKAALSLLVPEAGFIAEESDSAQPRTGLHWIIDPIDGTTNFMHNMPPFCISVALVDSEDVLAGVIYELFSKECFYAWKNGGAWLNGKRINVSQSKTIADSLLVTGFPYEQGSQFEQWIKIFADFTKSSRGVRRLGAAAMDMAYVSCGRFDAFYEYNLQPWDVAAGILLCKEAGGQVTDFKGGADYLFGKRIVCSNGNVHSEILSALATFDY